MARFARHTGFPYVLAVFLLFWSLAVGGLSSCTVKEQANDEDCQSETDCQSGRFCELGRCVFSSTWSEREQAALNARLLVGFQAQDIKLWELLQPSCVDYRWLYGEDIKDTDCDRLADRWLTGARNVLNALPEGSFKQAKLSPGSYIIPSDRPGGPVRRVEIWQDSTILLQGDGVALSVPVARVALVRGRLRIISWTLSGG